MCTIGRWCESKTPRNGPRGCLHARRGFTLLELLVALVLLDLGLIALAAASAAVSRVQAAAAGDARAQELASATVERIISSPCGGAAAGSDSPAADIEEWWTDQRAPNDVRLTTDSLVLTTPRGKRSLVVHSAGRC
jgi:prepilin-type N-terminal cleavage/methylation domain-containing protein